MRQGAGVQRVFRVVDAAAESTPRPPARHQPLRAEPRSAVVHVVEYSRYPRRHAGERRRIAYTQDRSAAGLGLDLPEEVAPGELLHVTLRDIDGGIDVDGLARVVWVRPAGRGRTRAGLAMLRERGEQPMRRVRPRSGDATRVVRNDERASRSPR